MTNLFLIGLVLGNIAVIFYLKNKAADYMFKLNFFDDVCLSSDYLSIKEVQIQKNNNTKHYDRVLKNLTTLFYIYIAVLFMLMLPYSKLPQNITTIVYNIGIICMIVSQVALIVVFVKQYLTFIKIDTIATEPTQLDIPILKENYAQELLKEEESETFQDTIKDILKFQFNENTICTINQYSNVIDNYLILAHHLGDYRFFKKIIQLPVKTLLEDVYLSDALRSFIKQYHIPKKALRELREIFVPKYTKVKYIIINNEIFNDISKAQDYLDTKIKSTQNCNIIKTTIVLYDEEVENIFKNFDKKDISEFHIQNSYDNLTTDTKISLLDEINSYIQNNQDEKEEFEDLCDDFNNDKYRYEFPNSVTH